ncbi:metalloprotease family protein [Roseburia hominis]
MKLVYKGKFNGDPEALPHGEHKPGAVKFKECENAKTLAMLANGIAVVIIILLFIVLFLRAGLRAFSLWGCLAAYVALFPHEFLHAICFKEEVYLYTYWSQGILFVVGPEDMSKGRFVFMSLLPNLVFGAIPFVIFLAFPQYTFLGTLGALAIGMGAGDYYNVFNALTQMPKGARTYLYQFNSYWYIPEAGGK